MSTEAELEFRIAQLTQRVGALEKLIRMTDVGMVIQAKDIRILGDTITLDADSTVLVMADTLINVDSPNTRLHNATLAGPNVMRETRDDVKNLVQNQNYPLGRH